MTATNNSFTGSSFFVMGNYSTWPAPHEEKILHQNSEKGSLDVSATPKSTIKVVLTLKSGESVQVETCQIVSGPQLSLFIFTVIWNYPNIDIHINGYHVASTDPVKATEKSMEWSAPANNTRPSIFKDITDENEQHRTKRNNEVSSLKIRPSRIPASADKPYMDLSNALKQLRDQIAAIKCGEMYHDTALATRLRALICRPKAQYPLLQRCAGGLGLPLILYAIPPLLPQYWDPKRDNNLPLTLSITIDFSPDKTNASQIPMDVDFWLQKKAARYESKLYTNDEIIRAFADTEGAHYDNGIEPLVYALRSIRQSNKEMTLLHNYFLMVAICILPLGEHLLQEKTKSEDIE